MHADQGARGRPEQSRGVLDAVHGQPGFQGQAAAARRGRGHALRALGRAPDHRRHGGLMVLQRRARAAADRRGDPAAGAGDGLRADVPVGAPEGVRAGLQARRHDAGRAGPCVLHQLGVGIGRHRAEDRHRLPARHRAGHAHAADRARAGLSRGRVRRHLGRRDRQEPDVLRLPAERRRPPAVHLCAGAAALVARAAGLGCAPGGRAAAAHQPARCLDHRRRDRGAGGVLDRRAGAARGLSRAAAGDHARRTASCSSSTR